MQLLYDGEIIGEVDTNKKLSVWQMILNCYPNSKFADGEVYLPQFRNRPFDMLLFSVRMKKY